MFGLQAFEDHYVRFGHDFCGCHTRSIQQSKFSSFAIASAESQSPAKKMAKVEVSPRFERTILVISSVVLIAAFSVGYFVYKRPTPPQQPSKELTYWPVTVFGHSLDYLETVETVFDRLGHRKVNGSEETWDILWSFEFPFENAKRFKDLKPHQLINHFPGMTFLSNKM